MYLAPILHPNSNSPLFVAVFCPFECGDVRGGASLGGDGVDAGPGGQEDADDGGVAPQDGRVQGRRVEEPVAADGGK